jgi:cation:H+ antiporter
MKEISTNHILKLFLQISANLKSVHIQSKVLCMSSLLYTVALIVGLLAAFGVAAELITRGTEKLEELVGQGMAGGVLLGLMAALPETIFVIIATTLGSYQVAIGAALGGNIILFTMGMGLISVAYFLKWGQNITMKEDYQIEFFFLLLATIALILLAVYGRLDLITGVLLFLIYVAYVVYRYSKIHTRIRDNLKTTTGRKKMAEGAILMLAGVVIIIILSNLFVLQVEQLSGLLGISLLWTALVITPIAADSEELISAYKLVSHGRGGASTAIVSFLGGKLQNNTILLGLIGILAATPVYLANFSLVLVSVIAVNIIVLFSIMRGKFTYQKGLLLTLIYFVVIAATYFL